MAPVLLGLAASPPRRLAASGPGGAGAAAGGQGGAAAARGGARRPRVAWRVGGLGVGVGEGVGGLRGVDGEVDGGGVGEGLGVGLWDVGCTCFARDFDFGELNGSLVGGWGIGMTWVSITKGLKGEQGLGNWEVVEGGVSLGGL